MSAVCCYPGLGFLCGLRDLPGRATAPAVARCGEFCAATYGNRRLWITFWREFWEWILGDFGEPTGLGASVRGVFSPKDPRMLRWASADLVPFSTFFAFLARFLPVFRPYFALFPSMPCAYLYVHNFRRTHVSRSRGRGIRGRRANLAFDKETAEATEGRRDKGT
jgi:hypothetical protein